VTIVKKIKAIRKFLIIRVKFAERIRKALPFALPERIVVAPDCGLKYLPREVAFGKMRAMVEGAEIVRREIAG
jgi:5-methyltetrahydropteroyltriglutamate--homocysteine methyltransferase